MKFVLSGGLILGTVDGANIEIAEEIGLDNIWLFGTLTKDVEDARHNQRYRGEGMDRKLKAVLDVIASGKFGDARIFESLLCTFRLGSSLGPALTRDFSLSHIDDWRRPLPRFQGFYGTRSYLINLPSASTNTCYPMQPYIETNAAVDAAFKNKEAWAKKSILACAGMGKFSSDRSIQEYANRIWKLKPVKVTV